LRGTQLKYSDSLTLTFILNVTKESFRTVVMKSYNYMKEYMNTQRTYHHITCSKGRHIHITEYRELNTLQYEAVHKRIGRLTIL